MIKYIKCGASSISHNGVPKFICATCGRDGHFVEETTDQNVKQIVDRFIETHLTHFNGKSWIGELLVKFYNQEVFKHEPWSVQLQIQRLTKELQAMRTERDCVQVLRENDAKGANDTIQKLNDTIQKLNIEFKETVEKKNAEIKSLLVERDMYKSKRNILQADYLETIDHKTDLAKQLVAKNSELNALRNSMLNLLDDVKKYIGGNT